MHLAPIPRGENGCFPLVRRYAGLSVNKKQLVDPTPLICLFWVMVAIQKTDDVTRTNGFIKDPSFELRVARGAPKKVTEAEKNRKRFAFLTAQTTHSRSKGKNIRVWS
jgi:hypothetical protein